MVYFYFKPFRLQRIGGVMPPGVQILGEYGGIYAGAADQDTLETLEQVKTYIVLPASQEAAEGINLIGLTEIAEEDPETGEISTRPLTDAELAKKAAAESAYLKVLKRSKIWTQVQDVEDWIADAFKLMGYIMYELHQAGQISDELWAIISNYMSIYDLTELPVKIQQRLDEVKNVLTSTTIE